MARRLGVLIAAVLAACGGDDDPGTNDPDCGDGACNAGETAMSCPEDCQGGPSCSPAEPDDCGGETICVDGSCVAAFGRIYTIGGIEVVANSLDTTGEAWDALGGAPDPFVEVYLNDEVVLTTGVADDVFEATFGDEGDTEIPAGSTLLIVAYDEDVSKNDPMIGCEVPELTADYLRAGTLSCVGDGVTAGSSIEFSIFPR